MSGVAIQPASLVEVFEELESPQVQLQACVRAAPVDRFGPRQ